MFSKQKLIAIGQEHFNSVILPQLREVAPDIVDKILVFVEGSVAYGLSDEYSDIDIDYYINAHIDNALTQQIRNVFTSQVFLHQSIRVSYGFGGSYWKIDLLVKNDMEQFWKEFNPYALVNIKHAVALWDPQELLQKIQARIVSYPDYLLRQVLRGLWITINDSGVYNTKGALERNNVVAGSIFMARAFEALLRIIYILNNSYYFPTKWLCAGLKNIENDFGVQSLIDSYGGDSLTKTYNDFLLVYNRVKDYMLQIDAIERDCLNDYSKTFLHPFYTFNSF